MGKRIPDGDLLADIQAVAEQVGGAPTATEYDEHGKYSSGTMQNHFGTWNQALEKAGFDSGGGKTQTGFCLRLVCKECGQEKRYQGDGNTALCRNCGHNMTVWRAHTRWLSQNKIIDVLSDGPATETPNISQAIRTLVHRIRPPAPSYGASKSRPRGAKTVYYLPGDERRALDLFIQENTEYVRDCLSDDVNPLTHAWSEEQYRMLVEQWEFGDWG